MTLTIFDLETTGLSPSHNEIIQIAAARVRVGDWLVEDVFDTFVRIDRRVPRMITDLTGITQAQVNGGLGFHEALTRFAAFAGGDSTLIAHNGRRFDMPFLREQCSKRGFPVTEARFIDSCSLSRAVWGGRGGHGLDAVLARLGLSTVGCRRHDARADVALLARAVRKMWMKLGTESGQWPVDPINLPFPCAPTSAPIQTPC